MLKHHSENPREGRIVVLTAGLMLISAFLQGCGLPYGTAASAPGSETGISIAPSHVTALAVSPSISLIMMQTPTPESSPQPTPKPTLEPTLSSDEILDTKVHDFLNGRGNYSDAALKSKMIAAASRKIADKTRLGLMTNVSDGWAEIEGVILSYSHKDGSVIAFAGFEDKDGKRFITGLEIPVVKEYPGIFSIDRLTKREMECTQGLEAEGELDVIIQYLDKFSESCNPVIFNLDTSGISKKWLKAYKGDMKAYIQTERNKVPLSKKLASSVWRNGFKISIGSASKDVTLPLIKTFEDINGINLQKVPLIRGIKYFK